MSRTVAFGRADTVDIAFADIDLNLQRVHVHDGSDAGAGKPPPAAAGATISPGCAALSVTTPAKGARTMVSFSLVSATATIARATARFRSATPMAVRVASKMVFCPSTASALIAPCASKLR